LLTIACFGRALSESGRSRLLWTFAACLADFLAVFSLASGIFLLAPLIAVAVWSRNFGKPAAIVIIFHAALAALYVGGFVKPSAHPYDAVGAIDFIKYVLIYSASAFRTWTGHYLTAGVVLVGALLLAAAWATWVVLFQRRPIDRGVAILLGASTFVLCEAIVTAYGRAGFGVLHATSSRYATASLVLTSALFAMAFWAWRQMQSRPPLLLCALLVLAGLVLPAANDPQNEREWRATVGRRDIAGFALASGLYPAAALAQVYPVPARAEMLARRMADLHLGPYAEPSVYDAPDLKDAREGQGCRITLDGSAPDNASRLLLGWAIHSGGRPIDWLFAYDGKGQLLGYTRVDHPRPDVRRALSLRTDLVGFHFFIRSASNAPEQITLMGAYMSRVAPLRAIVGDGGTLWNVCRSQFSLP
jgi:hypothetical protein